MKLLNIFVLLLASHATLATGETTENLTIQDSDFNCVLDMEPGCDPIPLTPQITKLLQNTDVRCGGRYTPTAEEIGILNALATQLSGS